MNDLRPGLIALIVVLIALSQVHHPGIVMTALAGSVLLVAAQRPSRQLWRRLVHTEGFVLVLMVCVPFVVPGQPVASLGPFVVTDAGLVRAVLLGGKMMTAALLMWVTFNGVDPVRLGAALAGLRMPHRIVRIFVLALRYLDVIGQELARLREAMRLRGFSPDLRMHTWRSYGNLIGMLLVRALSRADRIEEAMRLRGYSGQIPGLTSAPATWRDLALPGGACALAFVMTALDRLWLM